MRFNHHSHQNTRTQCPLNIRETIQFTSSPVSPPNSSKALFSQLWGQETSSALFPSLRQQLSHCVSPRSSWRNSPKKLANRTRQTVLCNHCSKQTLNSRRPLWPNWSSHCPDSADPCACGPSDCQDHVTYPGTRPTSAPPGHWMRH